MGSKRKRRTEKKLEEEELAGKKVKTLEELAEMDVDAFMAGDFEAEEREEVLEDEADEEEEQEEDDDAEIEEHQAELMRLKESDPEFFKHLQENSSALLEFGKDDENGMEEDDDDEEEGEEQRVEAEAKMLTMPILNSLIRGILKSHSLTCLRRILIVFRVGCRLNQDAKKTKNSSNPEAPEEFPITIESDQVYSKLMQFCFMKLPGVFLKFLCTNPSNEEPNEINPETLQNIQNNPTSSPRWKQLQKLVKTFLGNTLRFLDQQASPSMTRLVLSLFEEQPYLWRAFPRLASRLLRSLLEIWSAEQSEDTLRIDAFIAIRSLALCMIPVKSSFLDETLKAIYLCYARNVARFSAVGAPNVPLVQFLTNCVVELYLRLGDCTTTYQHTFVYIRQLAIHVRNSYGASNNGPQSKDKKQPKKKTNTKNNAENQKGKSKKSREVASTLCNWRIMGLFRLWARVLQQSISSTNAELRQAMEPLIYPFVQVSLSYLDLLQSSKYTPVRLALLQFLLDVASSSSRYIHIPAIVFPMLESTCAYSKHVGSAQHKARKIPKSKLDLSTMLSVPKSVIETRPYLDAVFDSCVGLMRQHYTQWSYGVAFPELAVWARKRLQGIAKNTRVSRFRQELQRLGSQLELNSEWIKAKRNDENVLKMGPNEVVFWASCKFVEVEALSGDFSKKSPLDRLRKAGVGEVENGKGFSEEEEDVSDGSVDEEEEMEIEDQPSRDENEEHDDESAGSDAPDEIEEFVLSEEDEPESDVGQAVDEADDEALSYRC